jgi:hypothetical protein
LEGSSRDPIVRYYPVIFLEGLRKNTKMSISIGGLRVETHERITFGALHDINVSYIQWFSPSFTDVNLLIGSFIIRSFMHSLKFGQKTVPTFLHIILVFPNPSNQLCYCECLWPFIFILFYDDRLAVVGTHLENRKGDVSLIITFQYTPHAPH